MLEDKLFRYTIRIWKDGELLRHRYTGEMKR